MTQPVNVLHVVCSLEPGGMENGVVNVANRLDPGEFDIHVACLENRGKFAARLTDPGKVHALEREPGFSFRWSRWLSGLIRELRPDFLHTHNFAPLVYGCLATRFGRTVPVLHGEHSQLTDEEKRGRKRVVRSLFYRGCRAVHTVSQGQAGELAQLGLKRAPFRAVINGVDTARFSPAASGEVRAHLGIGSGDAFVVGIVGRFGPFKGHLRLFAAFERIAPDNPEMHLLVVGGGGPEEDRVRRSVENSPHGDRIHLVGFQEDPLPYYRAMDLLTVPSSNEGLSNAALEAMACGVPVLAGRACGNSEAIEDGSSGFVRDLASPETLAASLAELSADPTRLRSAGEMARETMIRDFSLDRMASEYAALYREIAIKR